MKKTISLIVVLALALTLLAACGGKEPATTEAPATTESTGDTTAAPAPATTEAEATTAEPTAEAPTEPATEAVTETATETTTEATTEPAPAGPESAASAASQIASSASFEEPLNESGTALGLGFFGITDDMVSDASYYAASAAVAEEILVVKASGADAVPSIIHGMEQRRDSQIEDYADYVPKEVPKLEDAVIYADGEWVVFCVSSDAAAAQSVIEGLF
ncbi:MAG: DUF4358 domain-containing protein [Clostridia bacterium]|nr:DUF4358 domain-containing protein [Clostridia bacterium]